MAEAAQDERALCRKSTFADKFERRTGSRVLVAWVDGMATLARGRAGLSKLIDTDGFEIIRTESA